LSYWFGKTMQIGGDRTHTGGMLHAMSVIHSYNMPQVIHSSNIMPVIYFSLSYLREFSQPTSLVLQIILLEYRSLFAALMLKSSTKRYQDWFLNF
jgi:hypothetical protein